MAASWPGDAMVEGLDSLAYTDPGVLAAEQIWIFSRCWQFVGLKSALANHNDWVAAALGARSVMVQNFDGALGGFRNVCSHRHARLRAECQGNGMLRCPYHGWTYNAAGVPVGIPGNAEYFGLDRAGKEALALQKVEVACCGELVFARLVPGGPDLADYLGPYFDLFAEISSVLRGVFDQGVLVWRCNWKLGIESAIEGYHLSQIHPETFKPFVDEVLPSCWNGAHSLGPSSLSVEAAQSLARIQSRLGLARIEGLPRYDHYLIFPNLCLTVTAGLTLSLQIYEPVGADSLRLRHILLTGASAKPALRQGVVGRAALGAFADFNEKVLAEDQRIAEEVQLGKAWLPPPALLGRNEDRIEAFHTAWRRHMTTSCRD
jgi:choline monooxygenase